uniref:Uncharacterized protein n=1 Tax=Oryza sativa subsp. japonica TaxID=39947 RepID=Q6K4S1_ORYSJ|nr:hypothetical protein [Oryza sativa Japonica Group]BAD23352.1 hypothetical protein [Oryza sativa Japonica Group]
MVDLISVLAGIVFLPEKVAPTICSISCESPTPTVVVYFVSDCSFAKANHGSSAPAVAMSEDPTIANVVVGRT